MLEDECKIGYCERCNKKDVKVIADGYFVGFLCGECFKFVHGISED